MYLQADKPLFSPSFVYIIPPEEPFAEHEAAPVGPIKSEEKEVAEASGSPLSAFSPSSP